MTSYVTQIIEMRLKLSGSGFNINDEWIGSRLLAGLSEQYCGICGIFNSASIGGSKYFILFVDDYSRMIYIYFIKSKSEAFSCFKRYRALVENLLKKKIKILRGDNGKEFCNKEFNDYLRCSGCKHYEVLNFLYFSRAFSLHCHLKIFCIFIFLCTAINTFAITALIRKKNFVFF